MRKFNKINEEIKEVLTKTEFLTLTTMNEIGQPHTIAVKKISCIKNLSELRFKVYKMEKTKNNLYINKMLQIIAVYNMKGYRLNGVGMVGDEEIIFSIESIDSLL